MSGCVYILSRNPALCDLVKMLLEEVGFSVRAVEALPLDARRAVVDLDTAQAPLQEGFVTVSADPFSPCDLVRPFLNTQLVSLCLSRFGREDRGEFLPSELLVTKEEGSREQIAAEDEEMRLTEEALLYQGERIPLTPSEHRLFACLLAKRGEAVSESECVEAIGGERNKLTVYVSHLRRKLDHRFGKEMIVTLRKIGYMLK